MHFAISGLNVHFDFLETAFAASSGDFKEDAPISAKTLRSVVRNNYNYNLKQVRTNSIFGTNFLYTGDVEQK